MNDHLFILSGGTNAHSCVRLALGIQDTSPVVDYLWHQSTNISHVLPLRLLGAGGTPVLLSNNPNPAFVLCRCPSCIFQVR